MISLLLSLSSCVSSLLLTLSFRLHLLLSPLPFPSLPSSTPPPLFQHLFTLCSLPHPELFFPPLPPSTVLNPPPPLLEDFFPSTPLPSPPLPHSFLPGSPPSPFLLLSPSLLFPPSPQCLLFPSPSSLCLYCSLCLILTVKCVGVCQN